MKKDEELDSAFEQLVGRQVTDQERIRLYKIKDALKLSPNDSLWLIIIVLEHYNTLYEQIPKKIRAIQTGQGTGRQTSVQRILLACTTGMVLQLLWQIISKQSIAPTDAGLIIVMVTVNLGLWIKFRMRN